MTATEEQINAAREAIGLGERIAQQYHEAGALAALSTIPHVTRPAC
jgi:hypothetical protein